MARAPANGLEIEYETFGSPSHPALLLIMGLGAQLIGWDEELCQGLAAAGRYVVRFDNRDVGLSSKLEAPYSLDDMADDAAGLVAALGLPAVHAVGVSLGGMIAQQLALRHPARVRTLTSIMSTTGNPALPPPQPEAVAALLRPIPADREGFVERTLLAWRALSGTALPFDEERFRRRALQAFERCVYPPGFKRQLQASMASGDRREALRALRLPTLVIHGAEDPLIRVEAGQDTAQVIPGARLLVIPGMGHALPSAVWPALREALIAHTSAP